MRGYAIGVTLAPPDRPAVFAARTIDMRCAAQAGLTTAETHAPGELRCQLLAGHGGEHALMFADDGRRQVVQWAGAHSQLHLPEQDWHGLAWMRGLPVPAWFESDS